MAKQFDPSQLSAADQAAYTQWQQQLRAYAAQNGGGVPAPVSYAMAHPEYLNDHPELMADYRLVWGADLPPAVRDQIKGYHPVWKDGETGMEKNSGLWNKWETWAQIAMGVGVGYMVGPAIAAGAGGSATPAAAGTTAATGGSAAGTGAAAAGTAGGGAAAGGAAAGTTAAGGTGAAATGGTLASTALPTSYVAPVAGSAGINSAAAGITTAGASPSIWSRIFGNSTSDKVLTGVGMGSNLVGNIIQSRQASKAAEAQEKAAAEALALQSHIYQQQRADLAPYRNAGSASLASLSYGLGLNPSAQADTTTPYFQQQAQQQNAAVPGQAQPRNPTSLASLSGPVQLRAPNGQVKAVDPSQVQHYIQMGARPV